MTLLQRGAVGPLRANPIYFRTVIPFLHIGPLAIPTFGLMVAAAMLAAYFVLRADLERRGIAADLLPKVERILARLDVATSAGQMDLPGWKLHPLKGKLKGLWSVWVSGNWRITFRFRGTDAADVDLVDYH